MAAKKKRTEKFIIREFLEFMGFNIVRLWGTAKPDARTMVTKDGNELRLGIELTKYQVDAPPGAKGGSPGTRLHSFWSAVQDSLTRRLTRKKLPLTLHVHVFFKKGVQTRPKDASQLAGELVRFAQKNTPPPGEEQTFHNFPIPYPLIREYLREVSVEETAPWRPRIWNCGDSRSTVYVAGMQFNVRRLVQDKGVLR